MRDRAASRPRTRVLAAVLLATGLAAPAWAQKPEEVIRSLERGIAYLR